MSSNSNLPIGAEYDASAPYNQPDIEPQSFNIVASQTLSRYASVATDYYNLDNSGYPTLNDINAAPLFTEQYYTPLELIYMLRMRCEKEYKEAEVNNNEEDMKRLKFLIDSCKGWVEDEFEVVEE